MITQRIEDHLDALEMALQTDAEHVALANVRAYLIEQDARLDRFLEAAKQAEEVAG